MGGAKKQGHVMPKYEPAPVENVLLENWVWALGQSRSAFAGYCGSLTSSVTWGN